eukprot:scaffold30139_cov146-Isochrysis_galbana.AAC.1
MTPPQGTTAASLQPCPAACRTSPILGAGLRLPEPTTCMPSSMRSGQCTEWALAPFAVRRWCSIDLPPSLLSPSLMLLLSSP